MSVQIPTRWRSVLPHLESPLPEDRTPAATGDGSVQVNLPLALVRQSVEWRGHRLTQPA